METFTAEQILQRIRFDNDSKRGSVLDVIQLVTGCIQNVASQSFERICLQFPDLNNLVHFKFPGRGQRPTKVAPLPVLVKIIMLCPGKTALKWRMHAAEVLCRALGGDESLAREIETQARVVSGTLTENLRACPDPNGWTPLKDMDFSVEAEDDSTEGIVYLAGAPEFGYVKVGSWAGDDATLLSRYRTYYGPHAWVKTWQSEDRRRDEAAVLFALKTHSAGGELIKAEAAAEAARLLDANLPSQINRASNLL